MLEKNINSHIKVTYRRPGLCCLSAWQYAKNILTSKA